MPGGSPSDTQTQVVLWFLFSGTLFSSGGRCPCPRQGWNWMGLKVPPTPNPSILPWFCVLRLAESCGTGPTLSPEPVAWPLLAMGFVLSLQGLRERSRASFALCELSWGLFLPPSAEKATFIQTVAMALLLPTAWCKCGFAHVQRAAKSCAEGGRCSTHPGSAEEHLAGSRASRRGNGTEGHEV